MTTFNEINKPKQFENTNQGINHFFKYIEQLNLKKDKYYYRRRINWLISFLTVYSLPAGRLCH